MPRSPSGKIFSCEARITPPDQRTIENWKVCDGDFQKLIVCEEGTSDGTPRLHYHVYLETTRSKSWVRSWILCVLLGHFNPDQNVNGNQLYFTRLPHEWTIPYVVKSNKCVKSIGYTEAEYNQFVIKSEQYRKEKERDRKRKQRSRVDEYEEVFTAIETDLEKGAIDRNVEGIVKRALDLFFSKQIPFPNRNVMERYVLKLMYRYDANLVRSFYTKIFPYIN